MSDRDEHELRLAAPAKVNLSLRILGRRPDGYHLLDSLVTPVSLYDDLTIRFRRIGTGANMALEVTCDSPDAPGGPSNLVYRAAELFLQEVAVAGAVSIHIHKRIPVGSGLGGGSSDAATALLGLNRVFGNPCETQRLANWAARIGSDVPVFLYGRAARVQGVGETVTPITLPSRLYLVVVSDGHVLSTKLVYSRVDLSLTSGQAASNILPFVSGRQPISELLVNDLEAAAAQMHPPVLELKSRLLEEGALGALMTGSGSAVFGVFSNSDSADRAAGRLRQCGLWAESLHTLDIAASRNEL